MKKINYESDFDVIVSFQSVTGAADDLMGFDFEGKVYTEQTKEPYVFSHVGEEWTNCFNDGGKLHIVCDSHGLARGQVLMNLAVELPNDIYPDGRRHVVSRYPLGILLCRENEEPTEAEVEAITSYVVVNLEELQVLKDATVDARTAIAATEEAVRGVGDAIALVNDKIAEVKGAADKAEDAAEVALGVVQRAEAAIDTIDAKATKTYVDGKIADLISQAPETMDTLEELAAALGDDPNFSTTVMEMIGKKMSKEEADFTYQGIGNYAEINTTMMQVGSLAIENIKPLAIRFPQGLGVRSLPVYYGNDTQLCGAFSERGWEGNVQCGAASTAVTKAAGDSTDSIATTAFVGNEIDSRMRVVTQAEYDALAVKDENTFYFIAE